MKYFSWNGPPPLHQTKTEVIQMMYSDPNMERYFNSLPPEVRAFIRKSKGEISTYGELMQIDEHFKQSMSAEEGGEP